MLHLILWFTFPKLFNLSKSWQCVHNLHSDEVFSNLNFTCNPGGKPSPLLRHCHGFFDSILSNIRWNVFGWAAGQICTPRQHSFRKLRPSILHRNTGLEKKYQLLVVAISDPTFEYFRAKIVEHHNYIHGKNWTPVLSERPWKILLKMCPGSLSEGRAQLGLWLRYIYSLGQDTKSRTFW